MFELSHPHMPYDAIISVLNCFFPFKIDDFNILIIVL